MSTLNMYQLDEIAKDEMNILRKMFLRTRYDGTLRVRAEITHLSDSESKKRNPSVRFALIWITRKTGGL